MRNKAQFIEQTLFPVRFPSRASFIYDIHKPGIFGMGIHDCLFFRLQNGSGFKSRRRRTHGRMINDYSGRERKQKPAEQN
jgi:hypothetical protein